MMIAHSSGFAWDEALLVLAPIAVLTFLLTVARRRVRARNRAAENRVTENRVTEN